MTAGDTTRADASDGPAINKRSLWVAAVAAVVASVFAGAFFVGAADPDQIELRIFEDIAGDGLADGVIGDANNPMTSARVAVYRDDGPTPNVRDLGDSLHIDVVDPDGDVSIVSLDPSFNYWVVVAADSIAPLTGATAIGNQWLAEQTYGPPGSIDATDGFTTTAGVLYGGQDPVGDDVSGDLLAADHVALISPGDDTADFGFSFNVVVNTRGVQGQGTLQQFIQNANNVAGPNAMRFVPMVATNGPTVGDPIYGRYWFVVPDNDTLVLSDPLTTVDGRAYAPDGSMRVEAVGPINPEAGDPVGIRGATIPGIPKAQFQIYNSRLHIVEGSGQLPSNTTVRNLHLHPLQTDQIAIEVEGSSAGSIPNVHVTEVVIGTNSPTTPGIDVGPRWSYFLRAAYAPGMVVENSFVTTSGTRHNQIFNSPGVIFRNNQFIAGGQDVIRIDETSPGVIVEGNYLSGSIDYCLDVKSLGAAVRDNTFVGCGNGINQTGGVRVTGSAHIEGNLFDSNDGPGVVVAGTSASQGFVAASATISNNSFLNNDEIAIDNHGPADPQYGGDGITVNDGALDPAAGNQGLDYPVVTNVVPQGSVTHIIGTTCSNCEVEVYEASGQANDVEPGSGDTHGEGVSLLGAAAADGAGTFSVTIASGAVEVSAIAIDTVAGRTSEFGPNVSVPIVQNIAGRVLLDVNGDADLIDATPVAGAVVRIYRDVDGNGANVGSAPQLGDPLVGTVTTAADGSWAFPSPVTGYWVAIDSKTVLPDIINVGADPEQMWAEQTYGPAGSRRATYTGTTAGIEVTTANGPVIGGEEAQVSDDASTLPDSEHVFFVPSGAVSADLDTAFSFNVVSNSAGGDGFDSDPSDARTRQGSLRQFIQNANAIPGDNEMRFVPSSPPNAADGGTGAAWWRSIVLTQLPTVVDAGTTVNGQQYDYDDPTSRLDSNRIDLVPSRAVGVDGTMIRQTDAPEYELWGERSGNPAMAGLVLQASRSTVTDMALLGFAIAIDIGTGAGDGTSDYTIENNAIGVENVAGGDPGTNNRNESAVYVRGIDSAVIDQNLIGFSKFSAIYFSGGAANGAVTDNHLIQTAIENDTSAAVLMMGTGPSTRISNNFVSGANGFAIDTVDDGGSSVFSDNTIENTGAAGQNEGGIRVSGLNSSVERNLFGSIQGAPVVLVGGAASPAIGTIVTRNTYGPIGSYQFPPTAGPAPAIDISRPGAFPELGDGPDSNTGADGCGTDEAFAGSTGLDYPELTISASNGNTVIGGTVCANAIIEMYETTGAAGSPTVFRISFMAPPAGAVNMTIGGGLSGSATHYAFTQRTALGTSEFSPPVPMPLTNQPPAVTNPGDQTATENQPFSLAIVGDDPDDNDEVWSVTGPAGLTISQTGVISWTPDETTGGTTESVIVTLTAGGEATAVSFNIQVTEDVQLPVLAPVANQVVDENLLLSLPMTGSDPDGTPLTWGLTLAPPGMQISPTGVIEWTPDETFGGTTALVTVSLESGGDTVTTSFTVQVDEDNQPLTVVDPGPQSATEFSPFVLPMTFDDPDDPSGAGIAIGLLSIPSGMTWDSASREIRWTPSEIHGGTTVTLTFRAVSGGQTVSVPLSIVVAEFDNPPTASIAPIASATEFVPFQITPSGSDPEGVALSWSLLAGPAGVTVDPASGRIDWTPGELDGGTNAVIRIAATDGTTTPIPVQVTVAVAEDDQPPTLDPITRIDIATGDTLSYAVTASDPDDPADGLTYSLIDGVDTVPAWMSIDALGVITFTPPTAGSTDVVVVVTEADGPSSSTPFAITATDPVGPPATITAPAFQIAAEGAVVSVQFTATNATSYIVGSLPTGAVFDVATTTVSWPTGETDGGTTQTFTVTANSDGGSQTATATVQVDEVNQAPVAGPVGTVSILVGNDLTVPIPVTDADLPAQSFVWSLLEGPAGLQLSPAGVVTWQNAPTAGAFLVRTMVFNPGFPAQTDFADFFVVVQAAPTTTTTTAPTTTAPTTTVPSTTTAPSTTVPATTVPATTVPATTVPSTGPTTTTPSTSSSSSSSTTTTAAPVPTPPTTATPATSVPTTTPSTGPEVTLPELPIDELAIAPPAPALKPPVAEPFDGEITVIGGIPSLLSAPAAVQLPRTATVLSGAWILLLGVPLVMWERKRAVSVISGAGAEEQVPVYSTRTGTLPIAHLRSDAAMLWWRFRFMGLGEGQRVRVDSPLGRVWIDRKNLQPLHDKIVGRGHGT